jgi:rod shape-determining protein MreB and related proteins
LSRDVAIDLGSVSTRIYAVGRGVVVDEPSVVAVDARSSQVVAGGSAALALIGHSAGYLSAAWPIQRGSIGDFALAEGLLRQLGAMAGMSRHGRSRVSVCVSSGSTPIERRALEEACGRAFDGSVTLVDRSAACALGAGIQGAAEGVGVMTVDAGGGTTEAAVACLGGIVSQRIERCGGLDVDTKLRDWLRSEHRLVVSAQTAEDLKLTLACASVSQPPRFAEVIGRDQQDGRPRRVVVTSEEVAKAVEEPLLALERVVLECLASVPPELATDLIADGIHLFGGAAQLDGLVGRISDITSLPVTLVRHPRTAAVTGAALSMTEGWTTPPGLAELGS